MLRRVLTAYSTRNPALGYCQGMNFLAAFLLLWTPEEQAFWLLCFIVEDVLPDHFGRNMIGSMIDQKVFIHYMQVRLPPVVLSFNLAATESTSSLACTPNRLLFSILCCHNFMALLSLCKLDSKVCTSSCTQIVCLAHSYQTAVRVWDLLFMEGVPVVFLTALALFRMQEAALLATNECFKMVEILRNSSNVCSDPDALMRARALIQWSFFFFSLSHLLTSVGASGCNRRAFASSGCYKT